MKYPLQLILRQFVVLDDTASLIGWAHCSATRGGEAQYDALQASTIIVAISAGSHYLPLILKYYARGGDGGRSKE